MEEILNGDFSTPLFQSKSKKTKIDMSNDLPVNLKVHSEPSGHFQSKHNGLDLTFKKNKKVDESHLALKPELINPESEYMSQRPIDDKYEMQMCLLDDPTRMTN